MDDKTCFSIDLNSPTEYIQRMFDTQNNVAHWVPIMANVMCAVHRRRPGASSLPQSFAIEPLSCWAVVRHDGNGTHLPFSNTSFPVKIANIFANTPSTPIISPAARRLKQQQQRSTVGIFILTLIRRFCWSIFLWLVRVFGLFDWRFTFPILLN